MIFIWPFLHSHHWQDSVSDHNIFLLNLTCIVPFFWQDTNDDDDDEEEEDKDKVDFYHSFLQETANAGFINIIIVVFLQYLPLFGLPVLRQICVVTYVCGCVYSISGNCAVWPLSALAPHIMHVCKIQDIFKGLVKCIFFSS